MANAADAGHKLGAAARPDVAANPAWLVPAWYVNATTGNDSNTCVTSGAPCKTWGEIVNRWQTDAPWLTTVVTVTIEAANMPVTDYIHWRPVITNTGAAIIAGTDTTVATVSLGSVVPKNRSAVGAYPTGALTANLGGLAAQGLRLVNNTHPSVAWIDSVSGSVSTITQPMSENVGAWTVPTEVDAWANGDSVTIASPVKAYVSSFDPTPATSGSFGADDFVGGFIGDIWVLDPTTTSFPSNVTFGHLVMVSEVRADPYVLVTGPTEAVISTTHVNCFFPYGGALFGSSLIGGSLNVSRLYGNCMVRAVGRGHHNPRQHQRRKRISAGTTVNEMGDVFFANSEVEILGDTDFDAIYYGVGLYGTYTLGFDSSAGGRYTPPAASTFLGSAVSGGLLTFGQSPGAAFANAYDTSVTPAQWYPARAITPALLDTAISSGGFSGRAYGDTGAVLAPYSQSTAAPAAYVAPIANGGTARDAGCPDGSFYEGTGSTSPPTCAYIAIPDGGVTSVTGSSGVTCSPTTGAVSCSNTGVTSVTAGSGISVSAATGGVTITNTGSAAVTSVTGSSGVTCSPTTGSVVCSVAAPIGVGNGGTGVTSCSAGDFVQGNGTSPLQCTNVAAHDVLISEGSGDVAGASPAGAVGSPLVSQGGSADPVFETLNIGGGGTGKVTLTSGSILLGNGTLPVTLLAPGTSGNVATSNGSAWVSQAAPVQLGGFIDYVTNTLSGMNTSIQVVASVAESITFPRPVIVDASWICTDGQETNSVVVGVNVDNNTLIPGANQLPNGLGADSPGHGAGSFGYSYMSQHLYFGGLSTASHVFYFMAALGGTSAFTPTCTVQAVIHF